MSELNDRSWVTRNDPKGMLAHFERFPDHCEEAVLIAGEAEVASPGLRPSVVCLAGMGGSAAGGDLVKAFFDLHGACPFVVSRDYQVPNYVGVGDLVFCSSYSGQTEETLAAYDSAKRAGAHIIAITGGGALAERARADGHTVAIIPGGLPPRAALGYLFTPLLALCARLGLLPEQDFASAITGLRKAIQGYTVEGDSDSPAKTIARACHGRLIAVYGLGGYRNAVANRWKGQINENAKAHAMVNVFPELNHNEILGWELGKRQSPAKWATIALQDGDESKKMKARLTVTRRLTQDKTVSLDAFATGETMLERILTLCSLGDFVSLYLAALYGVDPETIDSINVLKAELSKV